MCEAILRGEVPVVFASEFWPIVCVADARDAESGKVGLGFVDDCCR